MLHQVGRGRGRGRPVELSLLLELAPLQPCGDGKDGRERSSPSRFGRGRPLPNLAGLDRPEALTVERQSEDSAMSVGPDPLSDWVADEEPQEEMRLILFRESCYAKPSCWNCGEFGRSRVDCTRPNQRLCYIMGDQLE